jgi:hypothetical protein
VPISLRLVPMKQRGKAGWSGSLGASLVVPRSVKRY